MQAPAVFTFTCYDTAKAEPITDLLVRVYLEVYADAGDDFFGEDRYRRQLASHRTAPGWTVVTATDEAGEMAGYAYGFPLRPDPGWWIGLITPVDPEFIKETGSRTFALSELMVREPWRGHGLGRSLHDHLLASRPEERATLLVEHDNDKAREAYVRWGWATVAEIRPNWEGAPLYEVMIKQLENGVRKS